MTTNISLVTVKGQKTVSLCKKFLEASMMISCSVCIDAHAVNKILLLQLHNVKLSGVHTVQVFLIVNKVLLTLCPEQGSLFKAPHHNLSLICVATLVEVKLN